MKINRFEKLFHQSVETCCDSIESPEIIKLDKIAQEALETRRKFLRPHKQGWWRNLPNPHAVGYKIEDDEL